MHNAQSEFMVDTPHPSLCQQHAAIHAVPVPVDPCACATFYANKLNRMIRIMSHSAGSRLLVLPKMFAMVPLTLHGGRVHVLEQHMRVRIVGIERQ
jgi:hypothetical protein